MRPRPRPTGIFAFGNQRSHYVVYPGSYVMRTEGSMPRTREPSNKPFGRRNVGFGDEVVAAE
ncbi:hypothetical protein RW1_093_00190 [Rhodococcus wratislaviensis NBRC 100605]|uniref:Uncharacterized protein n=1 Tax=Rhodococcus wratislaviensis NBRC 100605 TaxID=1219028 RepID=X0QD94_RHOWR|nr:hypothetical protein RW1_093_00190 [Rhodococcus wratislaviensis NBRC 100605]